MPLIKTPIVHRINREARINRDLSGPGASR